MVISMVDSFVIILINFEEYNLAYASVTPNYVFFSNDIQF